MIRKKCFTLLEILLVLLILSFCIALTGIKIQGMYAEQQFLSESEQILHHLSLARDLMLMMDTDIHVKMRQNEKEETLDLWLEVEKPLEPGWQRLIERKISLRTIGSVIFNDQSSKELTLRFSLGAMSKGLLTFIEGKESKGRKIEIDLLGYPSLFAKKKEGKDNDAIPNTPSALYPVEVYQAVYGDTDANT